jgi:hypothetical protein
MSTRWLVLMLMIMVLFEPGANAIGFGFTSNNLNGEKAEINLEVIKCKGVFDFHPDDVHGLHDSTSASLIGFDLTAKDAKKITCTAAASNRYGDKASVGIKINDGSLENYRPYVEAVALDSDHHALATQQIGSADGKNIELYAEASDKHKNNEVKANTKVSEGSIANYGSEAYCGITTDLPYLDLYAITGAFFNNPTPGGSISGKEITSEGSANGPSKLNAKYKATIKDGTISGYFDQGTEIKNNKALAFSLEAPANWNDGWPYNLMNTNSLIASELIFESSASYGKKIKSSQIKSSQSIELKGDIKRENWIGSGCFASPTGAGTEMQV